MDNKEILQNMFSSFVNRKTRLHSPGIRQHNTLPPLRIPNLHQQPPNMAAEPNPSFSRVSSSRQNNHRGRALANSLPMARNSNDSTEALATDSTTVSASHHCNKCTKAFRQRSQLVRHYTRVHEKRKPFSCAHCDKSFASAFDRKRHVEAVHGRRCVEFFCDRCKFRSKFERDLTDHIKRVHERDACRICGKVFKRSANLVAHERHFHSKMRNDPSE